MPKLIITINTQTQLSESLINKLKIHIGRFILKYLLGKQYEITVNQYSYPAKKISGTSKLTL